MAEFRRYNQPKEFERQRTFEHKIIPFTPLKDELTDRGRVYILPDQSRVLSVTTRIGSALPKDKLVAWREAVGDEQADKTTRIAASRGTAVHALCERYILNDEKYPPQSMPSNIMLFKTIKPLIDANVSTIYAVEAPLYSTYLQTAGRVDLIARWNNKPAIIDFKTSNKLKHKEDILGYFLQTTCYAMMFREMTGVNIDTIVIVIAVEDDHSQVFVEKVANYEQQVERIFRQPTIQ